MSRGSTTGLLVLSIFVGNHLIVAGHNGRSRADVLRQAQEWLLR
jgi:hypothetical protein